MPVRRAYRARWITPSVWRQVQPICAGNPVSAVPAANASTNSRELRQVEDVHLAVGAGGVRPVKPGRRVPVHQLPHRPGVDPPGVGPRRRHRDPDALQPFVFHGKHPEWDAGNVWRSKSTIASSSPEAEDLGLIR